MKFSLKSLVGICETQGEDGRGSPVWAIEDQFQILVSTNFH